MYYLQTSAYNTCRRTISEEFCLKNQVEVQPPSNLDQSTTPLLSLLQTQLLDWLYSLRKWLDIVTNWRSPKKRNTLHARKLPLGVRHLILAAACYSSLIFPLLPFKSDPFHNLYDLRLFSKCTPPRCTLWVSGQQSFLKCPPWSCTWSFKTDLVKLGVNVAARRAPFPSHTLRTVQKMPHQSRTNGVRGSEQFRQTAYDT